MSAVTIGFFSFAFLGLTLINLIMAGAMNLSGTIAILNQASVFRDINLLGLVDIPVPNTQFITVGIPHLMKWDYSFFGGNAGIIQYFLYSLTGMAAFGMILVGLGILGFFFFRK